MATSDKNPEQNEGWMFFKDIKGKLAKTLEERKQRDGTRSASKIVGSESLGSFTKEDYDRLCTEEDKTADKSLQLSPAIELFDGNTLDAEFESYVEGELQRAKCEVLSPNVDKLPSTSEKSNNFDKNVPQASSSIPHPADQNPSEERKNEPVSQKSDTVLSSVFNSKKYPHEAANVIRNFYCLVKSYWNSLSCRLLIAVLALCLVPVPSWFSGFIAGAFLSGFVVYQLLKNSKPKEKLFIPEFNQTPIVEVSEAEEAIIYKVSCAKCKLIK